MKIVYTGDKKGGVFAPNVMNHVFFPGQVVDAPDKKETHKLLESRSDFERAPEDSEAVLAHVPRKYRIDVDDFSDVEDDVEDDVDDEL